MDAPVDGAEDGTLVFFAVSTLRIGKIIAP